MNEDLLNVMGSFSEISLDCIEKQNEEIEQLQQERDKYKSIVEKAIKYINWSLEANEELTDMGIGLCVNNVEELLKILNGAEVKYFDRDKCFAIEVEELEEGNNNE